MVSSVPFSFRGLSLRGFWWRSVVGSALRAGCASWSVGASSRSFSGVCVRVAFASRAAAGAFARRWAALVGFGCVVRSVGGLFVVSVPVVGGAV